MKRTNKDQIIIILVVGWYGCRHRVKRQTSSQTARSESETRVEINLVTINLIVVKKFIVGLVKQKSEHD